MTRFDLWASNEALLRRIGGNFTGKIVPVSGIAGSVMCRQYVIPEVRIGLLKYKNIKVLHSDKFSNEPYHLLLSATMFDGLRYEIDKQKNIVSVVIPDGEELDRVVRIRDSSGEYHNLCESISRLGCEAG